jgi:hypothetical protein
MMMVVMSILISLPSMVMSSTCLSSAADDLVPSSRNAVISPPLPIPQSQKITTGWLLYHYRERYMYIS